MIAVLLAPIAYHFPDLPIYLREAFATRPQYPLGAALSTHETICEGAGWRAVLCDADELQRLKPTLSPLVQHQLERVISHKGHLNAVC